MIIHREFAQNSLEWLVARAGIPTASELDQLISPTWKVREGEMPKSFLARKLAEWWIGGPLPGANVLDMEFGKILEEEAKPAYEFDYGQKIESVGFITTDDGLVGCSPDGLIGEDGGIEIKCPEADTHVKYLLAGTLPPEYAAQVHGAMFVTSRPWWLFMSYRRRFPTLLVHVNRDEKIQRAIFEALELFLARFDAAKEKLTTLNGGPPRRAAPFAAKPAYEMTQAEIVP